MPIKTSLVFDGYGKLIFSVPEYVRHGYSAGPGRIANISKIGKSQVPPHEFGSRSPLRRQRHVSSRGEGITAGAGAIAVAAYAGGITDYSRCRDAANDCRRGKSEIEGGSLRNKEAMDFLTAQSPYRYGLADTIIIIASLGYGLVIPTGKNEITGRRLEGDFRPCRKISKTDIAHSGRKRAVYFCLPSRRTYAGIIEAACLDARYLRRGGIDTRHLDFDRHGEECFRNICRYGLGRRR